MSQEMVDRAMDALLAAIQSGDAQAVPSCRYRLALAYEDDLELEKALGELTNAWGEYGQFNDYANQSKCTLLKVRIYRRMGADDVAEYYARSAEKEAEQARGQRRRL